MTDAMISRAAPSAEAILAKAAAREKRLRQMATAAKAKTRRIGRVSRESLGEILTRGFSPHDPTEKWFAWTSPTAQTAAETLNRIARKLGSANALLQFLAHVEDEAEQ